MSSFKLDMHFTVQDIIQKKQRLQFETQRIEALSSGHFFKSILPILCDNGIISERRFMELVLGMDASIETKVTTKELLRLAVTWGVTKSPSEFWQTHRSRSELIEGLQRAKNRIDTDAKREQEVQERQSDAATTAQEISEETRMRLRRSSLSQLRALALGGGAYAGDIFSTRGPYEGGVLYLSRRVGTQTAAAGGAAGGSEVEGWRANAAGSEEAATGARGRALRRRPVEGRGSGGPLSTSSSEEDNEDVTDAGDHSATPPQRVSAPQPSNAGVGQHLAHLPSNRSMGMPLPSARAEWVASLPPPAAGSAPSPPEGSAALMTVETFVLKHTAGAGAREEQSRPLAEDSAEAAAAFRRYTHMMAQLPVPLPGRGGARELQFHSAIKGAEAAGIGIAAQRGDSGSPMDGVNRFGPRPSHSDPSPTLGAVQSGSLRTLPKRELYFRPMQDAATVTLVLGREERRSGQGQVRSQHRLIQPANNVHRWSATVTGSLGSPTQPPTAATGTSFHVMDPLTLARGSSSPESVPESVASFKLPATTAVKKHASSAGSMQVKESTDSGLSAIVAPSAVNRAGRGVTDSDGGAVNTGTYPGSLSQPVRVPLYRQVQPLSGRDLLRKIGTGAFGPSSSRASSIQVLQDTPSSSTWDRLSQSEGGRKLHPAVREKALYSADLDAHAYAGPGVQRYQDRDYEPVASTATTSTAVMQEIRTLERQLLSRPLDRRRA